MCGAASAQMRLCTPNEYPTVTSYPTCAYGCGPSNPLCSVPTAPVGANDERAASTAFVESALGSFGNASPFSVIGNNTNMTGPATSSLTIPNTSDTLIPKVHGTLASGGLACWNDAIGTLKDCGSSASAGNLLIGSGSQWVSQPVSGDGTLAANGSIDITKTNGVPFGTAATVNTGTSGATVPLLNGANTWSAGQAFGAVSATSLSATGTVSGAGFTSLFASPPAIGGTTPNSGTFSGLTNSALTAAGIVTNTATGLFGTAPIGTCSGALTWTGTAFGCNTSAGTGTVTTSGGTPVSGQLAQFTSATAIQGLSTIPNTIPTQGVTSGAAAVAGNVGEIITSSVSAVSIPTSNTAANITSITLTPGVWEVSGGANNSTGYTPGFVGATQIITVSLTTATVTSIVDNAARYQSSTSIVSTVGVGAAVGPSYVNITANTTYFLNAFFGFTGTMTLNGILTGRRIR